MVDSSVPTGRDLSAVASTLVTAHTGARVTLYDAELVKDWERNVVVRYQVDGAPGIDSVIVKSIESQAPLGFTDWASLEYLASTPAAALVPRFYGGDVAVGVFVMEDLGGSRSVDDLLRVPSHAGIERALVALAAQYGRLHAATLGDAAAYVRVRGRLPGAPGPERRAEADRWLAATPAVHRWLTALGCAAPAGFDGALDRVAARYAAPGPFLAFTHGDPAPTNSHVAADAVHPAVHSDVHPAVRLLDFEYGGFRHAAYDITAWFVLCPLPERMVWQMAAEYRAELAVACPAATDDERWRDEWAAMCAYRAVALLSWLPLAALESDRSWVERWTVRQAALSTAARLRAASSGVEALAALAVAGARLEDALRARWPELGDGEAVLPRWRAFERESEEEVPGLSP